MDIRKTKIICTLGPNSEDEATIRALMLAGMNAARGNYSHGSHEEHGKRFDLVKKVREELNLPVTTLLDTKGPEIRLGDFEGGEAFLEEGKQFILTIEDCLGTAERAPVKYPGIVNDVNPGDTILLRDGAIGLTVKDKTDTDIICVVKNSGRISDKKSVNVPGIHVSLPSMSEKDKDDIIFACKKGYDFIAASFIRSADDVIAIRQLLEENGGHSIRIIAKIENSEGVDNIDEILQVADGIMVARGDLGVEIPLEEVPVVQKMLIDKCYKKGKLVITATQMLQSMSSNPRPTRAEVADVANAIYDGTAAIMLSDETATGDYPVEAVKTMDAIARRTEKAIDYKKRFKNREVEPVNNVTSAVAHAACITAHDMGAAAIITSTLTGTTGRMMSKYRPDIPIIASTEDERTYRQLNLAWGVTPVMSETGADMDEMLDNAVVAAQKTGIVKNGDMVVMTAGMPLGVAGATNLLKVQVVGDILVMGRGVENKKAYGHACVAKTPEEAIATFNPGDILVIPSTSNDLLPILKQAAGIVTEAGGMNSHAAIVGMTLGIPVVLSAENATSIIKPSTMIEVDASKGAVSSWKAE